MEPTKPIEFLAIGDMVSDAFIELLDAQVHCDINNENCTISMRFGDKIPYKDVTVLNAVGNSPNASVAAKRLGLSAAIMSHIGDDSVGKDCLAALQTEGISRQYVTVEAGKKTNYHYVLQYGPERTILIKHESFDYKLPEMVNEPAWVYLSSLAEQALGFHDILADYLDTHPNVKLAFQPGTFQMKCGTDRLARIYKRTDAFFCNKEEARRILNKPDADFKELHEGIRALGPKLVIITDGPKGLTASDENGNGYFVPMYPDPKPPVERTGAGDATSSTIVAALHLGLPLEKAILWGPINSMSVVQHIGAQAGLLSRERLLDLLENAPMGYTAEKLF